LAVGAVEAGTLNRSAAILMRAGFSSRLAAIKAVLDSGAKFQNSRELREWLNSDRVVELTAAPNWPTKETAELWKTFRAGFSPTALQTWSHQSFDLAVQWRAPEPDVRIGTPVRLWTEKAGKPTLVLSADGELLGTLDKRLNPERVGLLNASVKEGRKLLTAYYLGPSDLFL